MGRRGFSVFVISANGAGAVYYLLQGRPGLAAVLAAVAIGLAWLAFRRPARATFRPVRTLAGGAGFSGLLTVLLLLAVTRADTDQQAALGGTGAAVAAVFTGLLVWALLRARRMGYGWSSELEKRRRPEDNPGH